MATPSSDNVYLGKGKLLLARHNADGTKRPYIHLGNCSTFEITTEVEKLQMKSSMDKAAGLYKEIVKEKRVNVKITGFEFDPKILAIVTMGDEAAFTQAVRVSAKQAAVVAAAQVSATDTPGMFIELGMRNVTVTDVEQGSTELEEGADWELYDAEAGIIRILPGASIAAATAIDVTWAAAAVTAADGLRKLQGATQGKIEGTLLFLGDPQTGPRYDAKVYRISLSPEGALGFISDDWGTWNLTGAAQDDSAGQYGGSVASPYYEKIKKAAAHELTAHARAPSPANRTQLTMTPRTQTPALAEAERAAQQLLDGSAAPKATATSPAPAGAPPGAASPAPERAAIVIDGQRWRGVDMANLTFENSLYVTECLERAGIEATDYFEIEDDTRRAMAFLSDVYASGYTFHLLSCVLVPEDASGAAREWDRDEADMHRHVFRRAKGMEAHRQLTEVLCELLFSFFPSAVASVTTSQSSSDATATAAIEAKLLTGRAPAGRGGPGRRSSTRSAATTARRSASSPAGPSGAPSPGTSST